MSVYVVAEAGINHCGKWDAALDLIDTAKEAGADCVKFQCYHAEDMVRDEMRDFLKSCQLPDKAYPALRAHCKEVGIDYLTSVFDRRAVDIAVDSGCDVVKVGSGEITNYGLLRYIGSGNLDLILSTGMATMPEVTDAVITWRQAGAWHPHRQPRSILHCVSNYPTQYQHCNLNAIKTLQSKFSGSSIGFSDHSIGFDAVVAAVAMGAKVIEKHFKIVPDCPDSAVSLTPEMLKGYIATIRRTEAMMGNGVKCPQPGEDEMARKARGRWHVSPDSAA